MNSSSINNIFLSVRNRNSLSKYPHRKHSFLQMRETPTSGEAFLRLKLVAGSARFDCGRACRPSRWSFQWFSPKLAQKIGLEPIERSPRKILSLQVQDPQADSWP